MHDAASSNTVRRSVLAVGGSYGSLPQVVGLSPDWVHEERHVGHFCNFGSSHAGGARGPVLTDASVASRSQRPVGQMALYEKQKSCSTAPIPPHSEGALRAIVTTREAGSDGRDRAAACPTRMRGRTAGRGREVAACRHPDAGVPRSALKPIVANGGQQAGAPGRLRISVKTVAQGRPVFRLHLWYLPPAFFSAGVSRRLAFPAPSDQMRVSESSMTRAVPTAGMRGHA